MKPLDGLDLFRDNKTGFVDFFHGLKQVTKIDRSKKKPKIASFDMRPPGAKGPSASAGPMTLNPNVDYYLIIYWERIEGVAVPCNGASVKLGKKYSIGYQSTLSASATTELTKEVGVTGFSKLSGKISATVGYTFTTSTATAKTSETTVSPPATGTIQIENWRPVIETRFVIRGRKMLIVKNELTFLKQVTITSPEPKCKKGKINYSDPDAEDTTLLASLPDVPPADIQRLQAIEILTAADLIALDEIEFSALGLSEVGQKILEEGSYNILSSLADETVFGEKS